MTARSAMVASMLILCPVAVRAGIYNTADTELETQRMSHDYEKTFQHVLADLRTLALVKPLREPPIWKRYALMESLGRKGGADLPNLEQTLNYSAVLIRRDKAAEAVQLLDPLTRAHADNFVLLSQFATACFLAKNPDFRGRAPDEMKQALAVWPENWNDLDDTQKKFLESVGWEETAFQRNRKYDAYLGRLMRFRVREEAGLKANKKPEEKLDPIFVDDKQQPVQFTTEAGEFEVGRIAQVEFQKLPDDTVEIVEQLLLWMPHDQRALWLLGEVLNARAMKFPKKEQVGQKNQLIRSAHAVFAELNNPLSRASYGREKITKRYELLDEYTKTIKDPRDKDLLFPEDPKGPPLSNEQWQRTLIVGFITGFAVGLFALWQFQEFRRRRQSRS